MKKFRIEFIFLWIMLIAISYVGGLFILNSLTKGALT